MDIFVDLVAYISILFLVLSCIEVGSNDATNLVNAVLGSRVVTRKTAIVIAGIFVILGATFSSPVMDTVRKDIFDIKQLDLTMTLSVFISAYIVSTILLYIYSLFGMPVSTTATLVFCLAGGALGVLGSWSAVNWGIFSDIILAIVCSIFMSGFFAFFAQRVLRSIIGEKSEDPETIMKHGPWITSLMLISLFWFMVVKGMKHVSFIKNAKSMVEQTSSLLSFLIIFLTLTVASYVILNFLGEKRSKYLFHCISLIGMSCMAFAFGQNDLANCASPGLAILMIWINGLSESLQIDVPIWCLGSCGFLMFLGMMTKRAQRVTRAEINTASQQDTVNIYAPKWCCKIAKGILNRKKDQIIKKTHTNNMKNRKGKKIHYDALRASVILSVGACVIAFASSMGFPVSTTYVAFAAVIASGWGDKVFSTGQAELKLGRSIWVIFGWFLGAGIAFLSSALVAYIINTTKAFGMISLLILLFSVKSYCKRQSDVHEEIYHKKKQPQKKKKTS